jgi:hypothetical protein
MICSFFQMSVWTIVTAVTKARASTSRPPRFLADSVSVIQAGLGKAAAEASP